MMMYVHQLKVLKDVDVDVLGVSRTIVTTHIRLLQYQSCLISGEGADAQPKME